MFNTFATQIGNVFSKLHNKGFVSEGDIKKTMEEIKEILIDADVALDVIRHLIASVEEEALGQKVFKSLNPSQIIIKIVSDKIQEILGPNVKLASHGNIMLVGLQGMGKTTTAAKIAHIIGKDSLLVSLDVYRPAAQEQLEILGKQNGIDVLDIVANETPLQIIKRAMQYKNKRIIYDTAGRLHINDELMQEVRDIYDLAQPKEVLFVVDAGMGNDAITSASRFNDIVPLTGAIVTRADGDSKAGVCLSLRHITGCSIKYVGTGEKINDIEQFIAHSIAERILGLGDIVSLVEKVREENEEQENQKMIEKIKNGKFDFEDMKHYLQKISKMGGIAKLIKMIPFPMGKMKEMANAITQDNHLGKHICIINSMTKKERKNPAIINFSRKQRIARGSGVSIQEVDSLIKSRTILTQSLSSYLGVKVTKDKNSSGGFKNLFKR